MIFVLYAFMINTFGSRALIRDAGSYTDDVGPFCPKSFNVPGQCRDSQTCWDDVNDAVGASGMLHQCTCQGLA
ncbi:hypothetical protein KIW84_035492 [Lathyrus oleraceus]|uniref:Uncharacterized protein n=1 Tax=Pisum sativum TaxID=3888 RepID=A0A9D5B5S3_PEA|nr:hypothetical protein KIW84_035492 [Pisum sativum]